MSSLPPSDYFVDRRRLQRKLSFWRVAAFLFLIAAVIVAGARFSGRLGLSSGPHIARIAITGLITGDDATIKLIDDVAKSNAAAVLVTIDSPGGTTTGSEKVYDALRRLAAKKKPTVAVVGTMAASGAYIAALGTDAIFAQGNSLVGSIGVLFEYPNFAQLLDKVGVQVETVKSSPLKASPNGFEPTSSEARAALASIVADSYDWFKKLVKDRRQMSDPQLAAVDDGRVFTGRQGLALHLVDRLGGERDAIAWLEKEKGVPKNLTVRDWKSKSTFGRLGILGVSAQVAAWLGFDRMSRLLDQGATLTQAHLLDGLVSIWQADGLK